MVYLNFRLLSVIVILLCDNVNLNGYRKDCYCVIYTVKDWFALDSLVVSKYCGNITPL